MIYGEGLPDQTEAMRRHEATCGKCGGEYRSLIEVQALLDRWVPPPTRSALDMSSFDGRAATQAPQSRRPKRGLLVGTLAGAIAALLGFAALTIVDATVHIEGRRLSIGFGSSPMGQMPPKTPGAAGDEYMLLLYQVRPDSQEPLVDHEPAIVEEYRAWAESLSGRGRLHAGEKLEVDGEWMLGPGHAPAAPTTMDVRAPGAVLAGFFIIVAESFEQAVEIAGTCPHLKYGGTIEIRRIEQYRRERSRPAKRPRGIGCHPG